MEMPWPDEHNIQGLIVQYYYLFKAKIVRTEVSNAYLLPLSNIFLKLQL